MAVELTVGGTPVYRDSAGVLREMPTDAKMQELAAKVDSKADASAIPKPATSAPPSVQADSAKGDAPRYALENHTHESRLQARRVQLVFDANGEAVYTFPKEYAAGVIPIVEVTAENTRGAAYRYDATILEGSTTNKQTTVILTRTPKTLTVSLLGAVLNVFTTSAVTAWVNIMSRAPS